jgi:hypothetical protein
MTLCNQCGKPAVTIFNENPLCVDCFSKLQQALEKTIANDRQNINLLADMIEASSGLSLPRFDSPQPLINQGPMTFNNIKVDKSIVGSINTGEIHNLDIAMSHINESGNVEFANALKVFTEAIIKTDELNEKLKNDIIEQLSFIVSQSNLPKDRQKLGIIKSVLSGIKNTVSTISSLSILWDKLQPYFTSLFKLGS